MHFDLTQIRRPRSLRLLVETSGRRQERNEALLILGYLFVCVCICVCVCSMHYFRFDEPMSQKPCYCPKADVDKYLHLISL